MIIPTILIDSSKINGETLLDGAKLYLEIIYFLL
jgi:hypothetical protein